MDPTELLNTINTTDEELASFEGLKKVMPSVIAQYADYWLTTPAKNKMLYVTFKDYETQRQVLKPLVRAMNKAAPRDNALLDKIPKIVMTKNHINMYYSKTPGVITKGMMSAIKWYEQEDSPFLLLLLSPPLSNDEDWLWAVLIPLSTQISVHGLEKEAPEWVNWLKQRDVSNFNPHDPKYTEVRQEIKKNYQSKKCICCLKEGSTKRCGVCGSYYCSVECQQKDWNEKHKTICKTIRYMRTMAVNNGLYDD